MYIGGESYLLSGIKPLSKNQLNLNTEERHLDIVNAEIEAL